MKSRLLAASLMMASAFSFLALTNTPAFALQDENDRTGAISKKPIPHKPPPKCELRLELPTPIQSSTNHHGKIRIKNISESPVTLVLPGDGSDCRWRTPIVGWSLLTADSKTPHPERPPIHVGGRCGNINPLKLDEVFTLKSGESREMSQWIGFPRNLSPGRYRVVFYYSNVPELKWKGIPLGNQDPDALRAVERSTPIAVVSNEVTIEVTK